MWTKGIVAHEKAAYQAVGTTKSVKIKCVNPWVHKKTPKTRRSSKMTSYIGYETRIMKQPFAVRDTNR